MAFAEAAWKHSFAVSGQDHDHSPDFYGLTPASIIAEAEAAYTATELITVSTNDSNFVEISGNVPSGTTQRKSHLFRFDSSVVSSIVALSNFVIFSYLVNGNPPAHRVKTYIRNAVAGSWLQLAASNSSDVPRSMTGAAPGPDFTPFVDGSDKIFILIWDWEGTFRPGGGCLHGDGIIDTPFGPVAVSVIRCGDHVLSWYDGAKREVLVLEVAHHYEPLWPIMSITTADGTAGITDDHPVETEGGEKRADLVVVGDKVRDLNGDWTPVLAVELAWERCHVYDVQVRGPDLLLKPNLFLNGVCVNVDPA